MRKLNEGIVATLMLAGINLAFALGMFTPNRGAFRAALEERGMLEEWSAVVALAAVGLVCGLLHRSWRSWSLKVNVFVMSGTYMVLLVFGRSILFSPFGNTLVICTLASIALLWLHEREAQGPYRDGKEAQRRARSYRTIA